VHLSNTFGQFSLTQLAGYGDQVARTSARTLLGVLITSLLCLIGPVFGKTATAEAAPAGPSTIVAIGDSSAAGEGAGQYERGTRGEKGDWCHRSPNAYVQRTGLADTAVNLACSGATSADVGFGAATHDTESSQAQRLVAVARTHRVTTVVAQFGANDDPSFGNSVVSCVLAYLSPGKPGCSSALAAQWPGRLASMQPKVAHALGDVRSAMRQAGYQDQDYVLVVASYPSPVTESMAHSHGLTGCPFRDEDARWGRTQAVPQLSDALRAVAGQVKARFLDLSRATEGHEACTTQGAEWVRRLTVNPDAFVHGGLAAVGHLAQESFHPNAVGYGQIARCLTEFVRTNATDAQCLAGRDGALHAVARQPAPAS
jgi:lysophospholipase L1-like esterase